MNVNYWTVRDTLNQSNQRPSHQATCALAFELYDALRHIASEIEDAETFASEVRDDGDRVITYQDHIGRVKEQLANAEEVLIEVFGAEGGE
jgi:mannitol-specific phosphotransferase system IIBC component